MAKKIVFLRSAIALFMLLFAVSLFKNIAYPLLWHDEALGAVFADRIVEYGYPKVHDGKNLISTAELPGQIIADKKSGAYIGSAIWGYLYFESIGAFFARFSEDIYTKTAFLRMPFAIVGFLGLIIMASSFAGLMKKGSVEKLSFIALFSLFELLSISLVLHLRDAWHPAIVIFLSACMFWCYLRYRITQATSPVFYCIVTTVLLCILFNTFTPASVAFVGTLGLFEVLLFLRRRDLKKFFITIAPIIISMVLLAPVARFFNTFSLIKECKLFFGPPPATEHFFTFIRFFSEYEFLSLAIVLKLALLILLLVLERKRSLRDIPSGQRQQLKASFFLSLYFIVYLLVIIRMPIRDLFERYYISLQPVLTALFLLDLFIMYTLIAVMPVFRRYKIKITSGLFALAYIVFLSSIQPKIAPITDHVYEIFHRYKGPVDYALEYIRSNCKNTKDLIIATTYEEYSYVYYLGCKVAVGYVGNNLEEDLKLSPDIIIIRKKWAWVKPRSFDIFRKKSGYRKVFFPVHDYPVNNIPDLSNPHVSHLFKTKIADVTGMRLKMEIKQDSRLMGNAKQ